MIQLPETVGSWGLATFKDVLKDEIEKLDTQLLPLQAGLTLGSYVSDSKITVIIFNVTGQAGTISAKTGIFYSSIIAGCSCADDPTPIDEQTEYCEVKFEIDKETAEAKVKLLS